MADEIVEPKRRNSKVDKDTVAPTGLELHPKDTRAVKLKRSVGLAAGFAVAVIVLVIAFAVANHKGGVPEGQASDPTKREVKSAKESGNAEADALAAEAAKKDAARASRPVVARNAPDVADGLDVPPTRVTNANGGGTTGTNLGPAEPAPKSPAELAYEDRIREELDARRSPMTKNGNTRNSSPPEKGAAGGIQGSAAASADPITGALREYAAAQQAAAGGAGAGGRPGADDQNKQGDKESYISRIKAKPEDIYLKSTRTPAISPYEIKAGWNIPGTLDQSLNSDLPGEVRGLVKENVYDTVTGHYLLIPQGSRVVGIYNHRIAYGQDGLQVIWTRLIYPDGSSVTLGGMTGEDARGLTGFRDKVDNHYKRLIGFALLTSAFVAGIELSQNTSTSNPYGVQSSSQVVTQALGQQLGELGISITQRNLDIQPTIKIPVGYKFNIRVDRDIAFAAPYTPGHPGQLF